MDGRFGACRLGGGALRPDRTRPPSHRHPSKQKVSLRLLRLDGLSAAGGEIEIKPAHAGCKFETIKFQTKGHPKLIEEQDRALDPIEVESVSADRDCSFVITLKEKGQADKTVRRTLRLVPPVEGKPVKPQELICYISSNSLKPKAVIAEKAEKPGEEMKKK